MTITSLLKDQDWLRLLFMAGFTGYLGLRIQVSTTKLFEAQMGSTDTAMTGQEMLLPSLTFCQESYIFPTKRSTDLTADFEKLPGLRDILRGFTQKIAIQNKLVMSITYIHHCNLISFKG